MTKEKPKKLEIGTVTKQDISEKQAKIVYLGIGSNLGDKIDNIQKAKFKLQSNGINILKCSSNYESFSWPNKNNPKFINVVLKIQTVLLPNKLLELCNSIEKELGRKRFKKNQPRTCDIDILDFQQKIIKPSKRFNLTLPHPAISQRNFVLLPLYEISKSWIHPKSKQNVTNLINKLNISDLRTIKQI
tara:strand:+ start:68 stop:631 length:564 start_codon:yes stop_codon:yes gene_type:complete